MVPAWPVGASLLPLGLTQGLLGNQSKKENHLAATRVVVVKLLGLVVYEIGLVGLVMKSRSGR